MGGWGGSGPLLAIATGCWVLALSAPQRPILRVKGAVGGSLGSTQVPATPRGPVGTPLGSQGPVWVPVGSKLQLQCSQSSCRCFQLLSPVPPPDTYADKQTYVFFTITVDTGTKVTCRCWEDTGSTGSTGSTGTTGIPASCRSTGTTGSPGSTSEELVVVAYNQNLSVPSLSLPPPQPVPVPRGGHVWVLCKGPPEATKFWLYWHGGVMEVNGGGGQANFTLAPPEEGTYVCGYEVSGGGVSRPSPPLAVLVEGPPRINPNFTAWEGCNHWKATSPKN